MDDMIYRNNSIAEENIDPNGHPAKNEFEEWSEDVAERTDLGYFPSSFPRQGKSLRTPLSSKR